MVAPGWWMLLERSADFLMGVSLVDQIVEPRGQSSAVRPRRRFTNFWWTLAADAVDSRLGGVFTFALWGLYRRPAAGRDDRSRLEFLKMNRTDWDWQAQLETCQRRIVELEEKIASERRKLQRLLGSNRNATFAQRTLAMREESLQRVQSCKRLIETRIADRVANGLVEMPCHDKEPTSQVVGASQEFPGQLIRRGGTPSRAF
jgi:hypothetical protein